MLAHELAHVKNRDILISSIAATIAGAISMLAYFARWGAIFGGGGGQDDRDGGGVIGMLAMAIVAPLAAMVIQMAVSRSREYAADATGAQIAGNPHGLADALEKLGQYSKRIPMKSIPGHQPHVHRDAALRTRHDEPVQHAPPDRGTDPPAPRSLTPGLAPVGQGVLSKCRGKSRSTTVTASARSTSPKSIAWPTAATGPTKRRSKRPKRLTNRTTATPEACASPR